MQIRMKIIKNSVLSFFLRLVFYGFCILLFYSGFVMYKLGRYSDYVEKLYQEKELEGKDVQEVINLFGWPKDSIVHKRGYVLSKEQKITHRGKYIGVLRYYTENSFINKVGWFPGGGCSIAIDESDRVIGFDEYLE